MADSIETLVDAVKAGRADEVQAILGRSPALKSRINEPRADLSFDATPLLVAVYQKNRPLIDVLVENGADVNVPSGWWAGGFHALHGCDPELAPFLIERGAVVDVHAASRLGMTDKLEQLLSETPALVHARGGDGQTPLHFAKNVDVARLLLERGADIDAIDVDHESTPAQWMVGDRHDVARFLVARGAKADILMAAALGDLDRTRAHLDRDPASVHVRVSEKYFPKKDPRAGGCIYIWTIGGDKTAHVAARDHGHDAVYRLMMSRSPATLQLTVACQVGDEETMRSLLASAPDLAKSLSPDDRTALAQAAQSNQIDVVRRFLAAGWPLNDLGPSGGTALHWASWHGNRGMVEEILRYEPDLEVRDPHHHATALAWAEHGSTNSWHCQSGDYPGTIAALTRAGASGV
jgi:ankyrin repeat protein